MRAYLEAHKLKVEQKNQELWLQGLYFYDAVGVALSHAFSKNSQAKYRNPVELFPKKDTVAEQRRKTVDTLNGLARKFGVTNG